jgi:hypothetical protein
VTRQGHSRIYCWNKPHGVRIRRQLQEEEGMLIRSSNTLQLLLG